MTCIMSPRQHRTACVAFVLLVTLLQAIGGEAPLVLPKPSANAGRLGSYQVETRTAGYSYWVSVPASYDGKRPAGLHLFFHGQSGQGGASNFAPWSKLMLEPQCLIGINMCFADGDNGKDEGGKAASALQAALQIMADYRVIPGRGVVACFSGGGGPCGNWYAARIRQRPMAWPFATMALYGANFWVPIVAGSEPLGVFIGTGTKEWDLGLPTLGTSQTARMAEALALSGTLGPDVRFMIVPGQGHGIVEAEVAQAASLFRRCDLAYVPFLIPADYPEKQLVRPVAQANAGQLGAAVLALDHLAEPLPTATALREAIDRRAAAQIALLTELLHSDQLLANHYGAIFAKGLRGHPREVELKPLLASLDKLRKQTTQASAAFTAFAKLFPSVIVPGKEPTIARAAVTPLEQIRSAAGDQSELGLTITELLALPISGALPH